MKRAWYLGHTPEDVGEVALLVGDPDRIDRIAALLTDPMLLPVKRGLRAVSGIYQGTRVSAAAFGMGAPIATIVVHELADLGVMRFALVGTAMYFRPATAGQFVLAQGVASFDGTSQSYGETPDAACADDALNATAQAVMDEAGDLHTAGTFATFDEFYRDMFPLDEATRVRVDHTIERLAARGIIAADMETAALAQRRPLSRSPIHQPVRRHGGRTNTRKARRTHARHPRATHVRDRSSHISPEEAETMPEPIVKRYLDTVTARLQALSDTQGDGINAAAEICADAIGGTESREGGLVFTFGTGHGSFAAMEMFPRTGMATGFRPIVESSMISFHRVLGDGGARQYRFIHSREGYGEAILSSHQIVEGDAMLIFSHSGLNAVTLDIAVGAKARGLKLIGVTSVLHSSSTPSRHSSGKRLFELADVVIDTGVPRGDASLEIDNVRGKVGATSTSVAIAAGQAINAATVEKLAAQGHDPFIMVSPNTTEREAADKQNDANYAELWRRLKAR